MRNEGKILRCVARNYAVICISCGIFFIANVPTLAACVRNDSGRNLFVVMKSENGFIERSFLSGDKVCLPVPDGKHVRVSILPYGGARFGCRADLVGEQLSALVSFKTMNKCNFN